MPSRLSLVEREVELDGRGVDSRPLYGCMCYSASVDGVKASSGAGLLIQCDQLDSSARTAREILPSLALHTLRVYAVRQVIRCSAGPHHLSSVSKTICGMRKPLFSLKPLSRG